MGQVVTAAVEVPAHTVLTQEHLQVTLFPAEYIPADAVRSISEAVNLVSDGTLYPGEMLLSGMLGTVDEKADCLAYTIPEGMRAMTIEVDKCTGVGGYITSGDRIDLLMYGSPKEAEANEEDGEQGNEGEAAYTCVVADDALVLAAGDITHAEGEVYTTLTLALTPEQCREVYAADCMCNFDGSGYGLCALLRSREDHTELSHTSEKALISSERGY